MKIVRKPNEKLGLSIQGGAGNPVGPPLDLSDEGVFVSKVSGCFVGFFQRFFYVHKNYYCLKLVTVM